MLFSQAECHIADFCRGRCRLLDNYMLRPISSNSSSSCWSRNQSAKHRREHTIPPLVVSHRHAAGDTSAASRQRERERVLTPSPQPSTSTSSSYTEPSLDVAPCTQLTTTEQASQVTQQDNIALNSQVGDFHNYVCDWTMCLWSFFRPNPAPGSCYHMLAAHMAVGLRQESTCQPLCVTVWALKVDNFCVNYADVHSCCVLLRN